MSNPPDADLAIAQIHERAADVLGDAETARQWMSAPQAGLAEATPQSLHSTDAGRKQVRALLERIEQGFLA
jgi:putative toxin-antitoxin system antitoxin component (TIGR02293 family)